VPESAATPTARRLRLNAGQWALAGLLVVLLLSLVVSSLVASNNQRASTETYVRTEASSTNVVFTMRESLDYAVEAQRYLLGESTRRATQVSRALLGQRLNVRDENGKRAGDLATPAFIEALSALDATIATMPTGTLTPAAQLQWRGALTPRIDALASEARQLGDRNTEAFREGVRASNQDLLSWHVLQLLLLLGSLLVGTVLLIWVAANVRSRYREARDTLEREEQALNDARAQLDRASALERGQAHVLERIARGAPLALVFQSIAALASEGVGGCGVRLRLGDRLVEHRATDAVTSSVVVWTGSFGTNDDPHEGVLEILSDAGPIDEHGAMVATRGCDLARLALERESASRRLSHQATHDALTGLANRTLLLRQLDEQLASADAGDRHTALLFCDLDRFKMVNDSIGHAAGDRLLIEAAGRILGIVRTSDTVARLGGDEFVVLCPSMETKKEATSLAERVRAALSAPYVIEGKEVFVDVSIGITFADDSTTSGADLMREADVAMYRAKQLASSHINVFDSQLEAEVAMRLDLDTALRRAIGRDEMQLKLQPVVRMLDGVVTGFEALIRWQRPGEPLRSPDDFIPLAEDNGVIVDIGRWVRRQAIAILADWSSAGIGSGITMAVNVSAREVREMGFADDVLTMLGDYGVPATALIIELTEHALLDLRTAHSALAQLRTAGVRVSLDDFGTGYSSLTQLRTLPVDQIKLDRSFAATLDSRSPRDRAVVAAVVAIADALALDLVVEGIETTEERDQLIAMGVRRGQGFLFAGPLEPPEAADLLRDRKMIVPTGI